MMKCTGFELLIDFLDGRLNEEEASRVNAHLRSGCRSCQANKTWYERVREVAESDDVFRPAPWVSKRAVKILEDESERSSLAARTVEALARLVYDSLQKLSYAGTRSMEGAERKLVYETESYSIDLQILPVSASVAGIVGQVLRKGDDGFDSVSEVFVDLKHGAKDVWSTVTNDFGEFMMNEVDFGEYELSIETVDTKLKIMCLPVLLSN